MKTIRLTNGTEAIVDDEDYEELSKYRWSWGSGYARRYAKIDGKVYCLGMHRALMNAEKGTEVDHINRNPLDNRKANLRVVSHQENMVNRRKHKNNTTGISGVYWSNRYNMYHARIQRKNITYHLGYFVNKEDAAAAYSNAAEKYHSEYRSLDTIRSVISH